MLWCFEKYTIDTRANFVLYRLFTLPERFIVLWTARRHSYTGDTDARRPLYRTRTYISSSHVWLFWTHFAQGLYRRSIEPVGNSSVLKIQTFHWSQTVFNDFWTSSTVYRYEPTAYSIVKTNGNWSYTVPGLSRVLRQCAQNSIRI